MKNIEYTFTPTRFDSGWFEENHCFWNEQLKLWINRFTVWRISDTEAAYCEIKINPAALCATVSVYTAPKTYYGPYYYMLWNPDERTEEFDTIERRINDVLNRLHVNKGEEDV